GQYFCSCNITPHMNINTSRFVYLCAAGFLCFFSSCKNDIAYQNYEGKTMGTYYKISFQGGEIPIRQAQLDSVLEKVNASMSTYIPTSTISLFNASGDSVFCYDGKEDPYFKVVFLRSKEIHALSRRSFNPAIMPLVNYYGFGYEKSEKVEAVDTAYITKTLPVIQFDSITLSEDPATGQICI